MSYCIYQLDDKKNESVIKIISNSDLLSEIQKRLVGKYNTITLHGISKNIVLINDYFVIGYYLLVNEAEIELVHKHTEVDSLFIWKLLPLECNHDFNKLNKIRELIAKPITEPKFHSEFSDSDDFSESDDFSDFMPVISVKQKLQIPEFKLEKISPYSNILIIGVRGYGKRQLISTILTNLNISNDFPENTTIISPTDKLHKYFSEKFSKAKIHHEYRDDIIIEQFNTKPGCIIYHDCINGLKKPDSNIINLLANSVHFKKSCIMSIQGPFGLGPDVRSHFDYVFISNNTSAITRKEIWMKYAGMFETLEVFNKVFSEITQGYNYMVICNNSKSDNISDKVFHFNSAL